MLLHERVDEVADERALWREVVLFPDLAGGLAHAEVLVLNEELHLGHHANEDFGIVER